MTRRSRQQPPTPQGQLSVINDLIGDLEITIAALQKADDIGRDELDRNVAEAAASIQVSVERLQRVRTALGREPVRKLLTGERLTRQEFYCLRAFELLEIGPAPEFQDFDSRYYDDGEVAGYINPGSRSRQTPGSVWSMWVSPDDVKDGHLSDFQRQFPRGLNPK